MQTKKNFLIALLAVFLVFSCKPEEEICCDPYNPDCPNFDACLLEGEADASFRLEIELGKHPFYQDTTFWYPVRDTFYAFSSGARIYFKANASDMDAYSWKVGADPRDFKDSVFSLVFVPNEGHVGNVDVRLAVANDTLGDCLEEFEQRDTAWTNFFIKDVNLDPASENPYPLMGFFSGYVDGDSSEVHVIEVAVLGSALYNFPGVDFGNIPAFIAPTEMWIFPKGTPRGYGKLLDDYKTLVIDYEERQDDGSWESHQFVGVKVQ